MRKIVLIFSMAVFFYGSINLAVSQEQPKPKKDTVNIDTDAKPTFYYAKEDKPAGSNSSTVTIAIIAGVVVIAVAGFVLLRRKKK